MSAPLHIASKVGDTFTVKQLLLAGANVHDGATSALHLAAMGGHTETVKLLMLFGAQSTLDNDNKTPSQLAIQSGHLKTAEILTKSNFFTY